MKIFTKKDKRNELEREIDNRILILIIKEDKTKEDIQELSDLLKAKKDFEEHKRFFNQIKLDTIFEKGCWIAGIILIMNYEKMSIITTKAFQLALRGRV